MNTGAIATLLTTEVVGSHIVWHDEVASTNDALRAMLSGDVAEGLVVGADHQTAGRGRFQRTWVSAAGENLMFSVLLRPVFPDDRIPLLNFVASLSVVNALLAYPGLAATVRWPNDVFVNGKKVCGILAERTGANVIAGIGINVNQREFPSDVPHATSLAHESAQELDRGRLLHIVLKELDEQYARVRREGFEGVMNDWRGRCDMGGGTVTLRAGEELVVGEFAGVDRDGALVLRDAAGSERRFFAGDATLHLRA